MCDFHLLLCTIFVLKKLVNTHLYTVFINNYTMEIGNDFKAFSFYERLDDQYLEYLFESAWDTLSKLYPDYLLDAADYFVIEMYTEEM